nr:hypothetical protein Itr_chr02CG19630 [Ipomoea trifida]
MSILGVEFEAVVLETGTECDIYLVNFPDPSSVLVLLSKCASEDFPSQLLETPPALPKSNSGRSSSLNGFFWAFWLDVLDGKARLYLGSSTFPLAGSV